MAKLISKSLALLAIYNKIWPVFLDKKIPANELLAILARCIVPSWHITYLWLEILNHIDSCFALNCFGKAGLATRALFDS